MDKSQAINNFWSLFQIPAYDENSVPDGSSFPYITYSVPIDSIGNPTVLNGSVWYRSTSWEEISKKTDEIAKLVGEHGFYLVKIDDGYLWITKGTPFAQRMSDESDDMIKRIYINLMIEFLTSY